jgi:nitrate reductase assembly molybdenum cofactor insertion protein NarJ
MLRTIFHITPPISLVNKSAANQSATQKDEKPAASVKTQVQTTTTFTSAMETPSSLPPTKKADQRKRGKKMEKFLKTPKKFFLDSKNPRVRWLHVFFPKSTAK